MITNPRPQSSGRSGRDPRTVELSWRGLGETGHGEWGALGSDGERIYTVRKLSSGDVVCNCLGFANRASCCHVLAVQLPRCFWCEALDDVARYVNPYEPDVPITLCARCAGKETDRARAS